MIAYENFIADAKHFMWPWRIFLVNMLQHVTILMQCADDFSRSFHFRVEFLVIISNNTLIRTYLKRTSKHIFIRL